MNSHHDVGLELFKLCQLSLNELTADKIKKIEEIVLKNPAIVNFKGSDQTTPLLHKAAENGHLEVVKLLLANNADVNVEDEDTSTPLHAAAQHGHLEVVKLLLAKNADVNAVEIYKSTPLHYAAENGHLEVVKLLLANNADVNAVDNCTNTPLYDAAWHGHLEVVKLLLVNKANVNAVDKCTRTPLHYAAWRGHLEVVKLLLENHANVNAVNGNANTPLHKAAENGHLEVVKVLLENDADFKEKNLQDKIPLALVSGGKVKKLLTAVENLPNDFNTHYPIIAKIYNDDVPLGLLENIAKRCSGKDSDKLIKKIEQIKELKSHSVQARIRDLKSPYVELSFLASLKREDTMHENLQDIQYKK